MKYTEQDVERVAEAICNADTTSWKNTDDTQTLPDVTWAEMRDGTDHIPYEGISLGRDHYRGMARAALEAIEREPLEDVLNDARIYDVYVLSVTLSDGTDAWEAQIMEPKRDRRWATGATIDEAIRNAVKAANEGTP